MISIDIEVTTVLAVLMCGVIGAVLVAIFMALFVGATMDVLDWPAAAFWPVVVVVGGFGGIALGLVTLTP